jgi:xanthine dehydrogenase large subunit
MAQVAARVFLLPIERVKVHTTNTLRVANTSPTAASAAADLNGHATQIACNAILERLRKLAAELLKAENISDITFLDGFIFNRNEPTDLDWLTLVNEAHMNRVNLSEHAHYATAGIISIGKSQGHPFAYHVYGTAIVAVTVDCLRGIYTIDSVKTCHDFGASMNKAVDYGQVEVELFRASAG